MHKEQITESVQQKGQAYGQTAATVGRKTLGRLAAKSAEGLVAFSSTLESTASQLEVQKSSRRRMGRLAVGTAVLASGMYGIARFISGKTSEATDRQMYSIPGESMPMDSGEVGANRVSEYSAEAAMPYSQTTETVPEKIAATPDQLNQGI